MEREHPRIEKVVIFTGYSCNSLCHFCIDLNKRDVPDKSTQAIVEEMVRARAQKVTYLEFIGGEATIRSDIIPLVRTARKLGFEDVVLVTNGRRLAYPEFSDAIIDAGLTEIVFSIHGPDAQLHDAVTAAPGSFAELLRGIDNARRRGLRRVFANCTVVKQNYKRLVEIGKLYLELDIRVAEFIFVDPTYGGAYSRFHYLVPRISDAAPHMRACLDLARSAGNCQWHVRYVPLCHFQGYDEHISELGEIKKFRTRHWAPEFKNEDVAASRPGVSRVKTERCAGCREYGRCEGMWKEYVKHYGDAELNPL